MVLYTSKSVQDWLIGTNFVVLLDWLVELVVCLTSAALQSGGRTPINWRRFFPLLGKKVYDCPLQLQKDKLQALARARQVLRGTH